MAQQYGFPDRRRRRARPFPAGPQHAAGIAVRTGRCDLLLQRVQGAEPALRMGYLAAAPALLKLLMRTKIHAIMTLPALNEYVLLEVLKADNLRKHLEWLQCKIMVARNANTQHLSAAGVLFEQPGDAGIFL
jgi:hypothetical protein